MTKEVPVEKKGLVSRVGQCIRSGLAAFSRRLGKCRAKTWGYLVLWVVVIIFIVQNFTPMRIEFLVFGPFIIPFSILAIFFTALGLLLAYLYRSRLKM